MYRISDVILESETVLIISVYIIYFSSFSHKIHQKVVCVVENKTVTGNF